MSEEIMLMLLYIVIIVIGLVIGSFLNVCIFRIPKRESVVLPSSHCMKCGYQLRWHDLVPIFSFLLLRGRCRKCKTKLSLQYPLIEGLNGALYAIVFLANGWNWMSIVYCLLTSALIVLSMIDFRTYEIPDRINLFIFLLGVLATVLDWNNWKEHLIGFFAVSLVLFIIYLVTAGRGIGGGDIKLMAAAGLILGWKLIIVSFIIGCITGSVIHVIRMKVSGAEKLLALGPYLSIGIWVSVLFGNGLIDWYLRICGL